MNGLSDRLGRAAYEAYCDTTSWKSAVSGDPLPTWSAQRPDIKLAWVAAALGVTRELANAARQS